MSLIRMVFFSSLATFAFAAAASASTLPAGKSSAGIRLIAGPSGGRILLGRERGMASSVAGLRAAIAAGGGYFDRRPTVKSVGTSGDGRAAYGSFDASLQGVPVSGIAIVALQSGGDAQVIALFDRPANLKTSLRPMLASLGGRKIASSSGASGPISPSRPLHEYDLPDRSGSALLPPDWVVTSANQGQLIAHDPSTRQNAILGVTVPVEDPRAGMGARIAANSGAVMLAYESDPVAAFVALSTALARRSGVAADVHIATHQDLPSQRGRAAYMVGDDMTQKGYREGFFGIVSVSPIMAMGGYNVTVTMMNGPVEAMPRNISTLAAIFKSYSVNGRVREEQTSEHERDTIARTEQTIAGIHATGDASMANAAASQAAIDRSTSGYVHYLNGSDVIENIGSGSRASIDSDFAQDLAKSDPQNFRVVPMTEYRAGE